MRERAEELGGRCTIEALPLRASANRLATFHTW
jgi:signal transduction histidine kinase